jgi:hypothetical protein
VAANWGMVMPRFLPPTLYTDRKIGALRRRRNLTCLWTTEFGLDGKTLRGAVVQCSRCFFGNVFFKEQSFVHVDFWSRSPSELPCFGNMN